MAETAPVTETAPKRTGMGIVTYALGIHQRNRWEGRHAGLPPAVSFLEECRLLGAGGMQVPIGARDSAAEIRRRVEVYGMYVEAIADPPRTEVDRDRFEREIVLAKEAGARLVRGVVFPGRRYEEFRSIEAFREAESRARRSLRLAAPILDRHAFRLAVENHKDQRVTEKLEMLRRIGSERIGLCVDVGNPFALMEDPVEAVRAFAPWAFTVHIKDQAVRESEDGFLMADVALGDGVLDLPAIVRILREAKPDIRFNFETITRDPIRLPILTDGYWSTLADTPARELGRTWRIVKTQGHPGPFPAVSILSREEQLALERRNIERSIAYARDRLGI